MAAGITIRGIPEIQRNLRDFPRQLVQRAFTKALSRAAAVFEEELRSRCPESDSDSSDESGHLIDFLTSEITIDSGGRGGRARIGFGRLSRRALWVEYGHRMVSHKGKQIGEVKPHPFMRAAFAAAADKAIEAFTEAIREYMGD